MAYWGMLDGIGQKNSSIRNTFVPGTDLPNVKYYGISLPDAETMRFISHLAKPDELVDVKTTIESLIATLVDSLGKGSAGDQKERVFSPN